MPSGSSSSDFAALFVLALMFSQLLTFATSVAADGSNLTAALTEWTIPTADSMPTGLALDPSGDCCWFLESAGNKVVHFNPLSNTFREWAIPTACSEPRGLAIGTVSGQLIVFGTEFAKNNIFVFFPGTGAFKEYNLPTVDSGPLHMSLELREKETRAWFTELGGLSNRYSRNVIGELIYDHNKGHAKLLELKLPLVAGGGADDIHADSGMVWFGTNKGIVRWDQTARRFTTWALPNHPSTHAASIEIDPNGQVWYASTSTQLDSADNYVGVLRTNSTITEWHVGTTGAGVEISSSPVAQKLWIAEPGRDKIAELNPSVGGISTSSRPVTTQSEPESGQLLTSVAGPVLPSTNKIPPVARIIDGWMRAELTEWTLTTGSRPSDLVVDAYGNIWILESSSNKVARLSLTPNFDLRCDPSSLGLAQGGSTMGRCYVTSVYGLNSPVDLAGSWVGLPPAGVAYTLPSPITPDPDETSSSTLVIVASAKASTGTFTLQVTGTAGSLTHKLNLTVTIATGLADFQIRLVPTYLTIVPGGSARTTVSVHSIGIFSSPVELEIFDAPRGVTLRFQTNPLTPQIGGAASSILTVSVSGTPEGAYVVTIIGTSGSLTHSDVLNVQVGGGACLIATATYGSDLSDEVQFLRDFRDRSILRTHAGSSFMIAFNAWYYSFSPTVAQLIRDHPASRTAVRIMIYPLMGILRLSAAMFHFFSMNMEAAAVLAGLLASSLIGAVYLTLPVTLALRCSSKARRIAKRLEMPISCGLLGSLAALAILMSFEADATTMSLATSTVVLTTLTLSALLSSKALLSLGERLRAHGLRYRRSIGHHNHP